MLQLYLSSFDVNMYELLKQAPRGSPGRPKGVVELETSMDSRLVAGDPAAFDSPDMWGKGL